MDKIFVISGIIILVFLVVGVRKMMNESDKEIDLQAINQTCMESESKGELRFWECFCRNMTDKKACSQHPDCAWADSNKASCIEKPCTDYKKEECMTNSRCMWVFDKNKGSEYCEGTAFFSPERHVRLG